MHGFSISMNRPIRWIQQTLKVPASCCLPGVGRFRRPSRNDGLVVCLLSMQPRQSLWLWAMFPLYTRRCTKPRRSGSVPVRWCRRPQRQTTLPDVDHGWAPATGPDNGV